MISQLDLAGTSSMAHLGLRWWSELDGTSPISLSLVSLRALSLSLSLSLFVGFFFSGGVYLFLVGACGVLDCILVLHFVLMLYFVLMLF